MLELKKINKTYKTRKGIKTEALKEVSLTIKDKSLVFILGKSGCGKSTLLNIMGGLDNYDTGDLIIDGKSTKRFKEKEFDAYRNTYMGFIFQDYNILDKYTVYKNISIPLELQNKKIDKKELDSVLKKVGLENLGNRKANELSGGQKQRVAIARALIKDPKIIFADEPTGNLDSTSGRQIFELLKELSKEKAVVVVSHDSDSAEKYADRIIEMADGVITHDSNKENSVDLPDKAILKKARLPLKYSIKMGIGNLFHKKIKLLFTILLTTASLVCLGITKSATSTNLAEQHLNILLENNEYTVYLNKYDKERNFYDIAKNSFNFNVDSMSEEQSFFTPEKIDDNFLLEVENKTGLNWYKKTIITQKSSVISFKLGENSFSQAMYYNYANNPISVVELDGTENFKIIGNTPQNNDELLISKYVADVIMEYGIFLKKEKNKEEQIYKPISYNQIILDGKYIQINELDKTFKIVGIIDDDLTSIQTLKSISLDEYNSSYDYDDEVRLLSSNLNQYFQVYVTKDFISNLNLKDNNIGYMTSKILKNDKVNIVNQIGYISGEIEAFNGNNIVKYNSLGDNEILIDINVLNDITNNDYVKKLDKYIENNSFNENFSIDNFAKRYIKDNKIIDSKILSSVTKGKIVHSNENYAEYTIKGVIIKNEGASTIYYSKNILNNLLSSNVEFTTIFTTAKNKQELVKIFDLYPIDKSDTLTSTKYSNEVLSGIIFSYLLETAGKYGSVFFLVFSIFLLMNFISTSISFRKKEIGILRALGCKSMDVLKIFMIESVVLITICLLLANFVIQKLVVLFNNTISKLMLSSVRFFEYGDNELIYISLITLSIIIIANIIPIRRITKMKPIEAIRK